MALSRVHVSVLGLGATVLLATQNFDTRAEAQVAASNAQHTAMGNPITGEGLPNPAPTVTRNWGELPAGRKWGTTAGIDVDPIDGNVWAYERCGAGTAGGGPVDCDNTPLDPIFKFDRKTGAMLANFGKGIMVTPHGIAVDKQGNVWIAWALRARPAAPTVSSTSRTTSPSAPTAASTWPTDTMRRA